jgi:hypothetical protein
MSCNIVLISNINNMEGILLFKLKLNNKKRN